MPSPPSPPRRSVDMDRCRAPHQPIQPTLSLPLSLLPLHTLSRPSLSLSLSVMCVWLLQAAGFAPFPTAPQPQPTRTTVAPPWPCLGCCTRGAPQRAVGCRMTGLHHREGLPGLHRSGVGVGTTTATRHAAAGSKDDARHRVPVAGRSHRGRASRRTTTPGPSRNAMASPSTKTIGGRSRPPRRRRSTLAPAAC